VRWGFVLQGDTKKRELLKNPTKIVEIQKKILLTEIEPLQLAVPLIHDY
jgi:predicted metalloprotease